MQHSQHIIVLDFGSQYTQLIARRVREMGVYCEIVPFRISAGDLSTRKPSGIIFSGSPTGVYERNAPVPDLRIFKMGIPILGICYGMQIIVRCFGGRVEKAPEREYGPRVASLSRHALFRGLPGKAKVWMSHGDYVVSIPEGWRIIATTPTCPICAVEDPTGKILAVQFHPEVSHTPNGKIVLKNFVKGICKAPANWSMESFIDEAIDSIRKEVGKERVLCALSGGVDSSVTASLVSRAIGSNLVCIFVDNGLLRKNETDAVKILEKAVGLNIKYINAKKRFLNALKGVADPEAKRRIIGHEFIKVFESFLRRKDAPVSLAQGTLYPDVIESTSVNGPSATIKSHHNVGGLPRNMRLRLIEPLRELFKDEVRAVGKLLGVPKEILERHPFPGPGLSVRIIGPVTRAKLNVLREVDWILIDEVKKAGLYSKIWQAFAVLLPVKTVGVMGDKRTYRWVVAIRAVTSRDGMTADWARIPHDVMEQISTRIVNSVPQVNRVVFDITPKPPATIEWE